MTLGTITDGHADAEEAYDEYRATDKVSDSVVTEMLPPKKLIYGGVGDVRVRDVIIAQAAKGKCHLDIVFVSIIIATISAAIVTYGVGCDKDAARKAQAANVKIMSFECVQDAISLITNQIVKPTTGEDVINLVTKPKRRDTQHD